MPILALLLALLLGAPLAAQQPQTNNPLYNTNSQYTQGWGPGYWPTAGTWPALNLSAGTANCLGVIVTYAGGSLPMTASATNYVYLNSNASCVPNSNTSGFPVGSSIPIATVVAGASAITSLQDDRTMMALSGGGAQTSFPLVQSNSNGVVAGGGSSAVIASPYTLTITLPHITTAGNTLLVEIVESYNGTPPNNTFTISDTQGNTYAQQGSALQSVTSHGLIGSAVTSQNAADTVTVVYTNFSGPGACNLFVWVGEYHGLGAYDGMVNSAILSNTTQTTTLIAPHTSDFVVGALGALSGTNPLLLTQVGGAWTDVPADMAMTASGADSYAGKSFSTFSLGSGSVPLAITTSGLTGDSAQASVFLWAFQTTTSGPPAGATIGLTMPAQFAVTGSPVTSAGTLGVNWGTGGDVTTVNGVGCTLGTTCTIPVGLVSSVGLAMPTAFSVSGSPVTGTGTLGASWAPAPANSVLATKPSGTSPPALVQVSPFTGNASCSAASASTTFTYSTQAGDAILLLIQTNGTPTITDTQGLTFTLLSTNLYMNWNLYVATNITGGAETVGATVTGGNFVTAIVGAETTSLATSATLDAANGGAVNAQSFGSSLTTTAANDLLLSFGEVNLATPIFSVATPFAIALESAIYCTSNSWYTALAFAQAPTVSAYNVSWNAGVSPPQSGAAIYALKAGTSSITGFFPRSLEPSDLPFLAPSATTDTTNASNISSGTLAAARLPGAGVTTINSTGCTIGSSCTISTAPTGSAGGDLGSTYPNPTVTATHLASALPVAQGGLGTTTSPSVAQLPIGITGGGSYAPQTLSGDCTLSAAGVMVCTKTNGTAFAPSATTDTTNASNISSGTLGIGLFPNGTTGSGAFVLQSQPTINGAAFTNTATSSVAITGTAPASVSTTPGTSASVQLSVAGVPGGATSITTAGQAGVGSSVSFTSGAGGAATGAGLNTTVGGAGGSISISAGAGGAGSAGNDSGGAGGNITLTSGAGGAKTGSGTAGAAGNINLNGLTIPTAGNYINGASSVNINFNGASNASATVSAGLGVILNTNGGAVSIRGGLGICTALGSICTPSSSSLVMDMQGQAQVSGTAPASVGTTPGTSFGAQLNVTGVAGGATSITTTGQGGVGSTVSIAGGTGGAATGAGVSTTVGGAGGGVAITAGAGGAGTAGNDSGGAGGNITLTPGAGGAKTGTGSAGAAGNIGLAGNTAVTGTLSSTGNGSFNGINITSSTITDSNVSNFTISGTYNVTLSGSQGLQLTGNGGVAISGGSSHACVAAGAGCTPATGTMFDIQGAGRVGGHLYFHTAAPTIGGTGCTIVTGSTDQRGQITLSTGATSCTVTFATAFSNPMPMVAASATAITPVIASLSTTVLTIGVSAASGTVYYYVDDVD